MELDRWEWVLSQEEVWDFVQYLFQGLLQDTCLHIDLLLYTDMDILPGPDSSMGLGEVAACSVAGVEVVVEDDGSKARFLTKNIT
jgi:hypothetical protein